MKQARQSLGNWGESTAAAYLAANGYTVIERNVRTPYGEIDLVAEKEGEIVFVEVKTRTNRTFGAPEVSVSTRKKSHMIASAEYYRQSHPDLDPTWRIDVISIERRGNAAEIVHFENAV